MTENKRYTREEVNKLIHDVRNQYFRLFGDDMTLSERLLYTDICDFIENQVDYKMELLKSGIGNDRE